MGVYRDLCEDQEIEIRKLNEKIERMKELLTECKSAIPNEYFRDLIERIDNEVFASKIEIEELCGACFSSLDDLMEYIKDNFTVDEMEDIEYLNGNGEVVKELGFTDRLWDYSVYYEFDKDEDLCVVEVGKQRY